MLLSSCRRSEVELVPVEGTITYGGGDWPVPGTLAFTPIERKADFPLRPGWANFGADGKFQATTFKEGDGLVPGAYQVAVEAFLTPWEMGKAKPESCVLKEFESPATSGLTVAVDSGKRKMTVQWNVPRP